MKKIVHVLSWPGAFWLASSLPSLAVLNLPDQFNVGNFGDVTVASASQILQEVGQPVDNTYSGTLTFTVTIEYNTLSNGDGSAGFTAFQFFGNNNTQEKLAIGDGWGENKWGGFFFGTGGPDFTDGNGPVPLSTGTPETITFTIDYVAGGNDNLTVTFRGVQNFFSGDYGFDAIRTRSGGGNQTANFTGMSLAVAFVDSDGDGMPDPWENLYGLDPNDNSDAGEDLLDGDGLSNLREYTNLSNPTLADTDGDRLEDGAEVDDHFSLPNDRDSDDDGLEDGDEVEIHFTLPDDTDSDNDGFNDAQEIAAGTNPLVTGSVPTRYVQNFDDFNNGATALVDGSSMESNNGITSVQNGALRVTEFANLNASGVFRLPPLANSAQGWCASFDVRFSQGRNGSNPADGMSFSYGSLPATGLAPAAEEGWTGTQEHVSYEIDPYDADGAERGVNVADQADGFGQADLGFTNGPVFASATEVAGTVICRWRPDPGRPGESLVSFTTTGLLTNAAFADLEAFVNGNNSHIFAIAARTGGFSETVIIDNLAITTGADADTDDDNLPDCWEWAQIGNLSEGGSSNNDGDALTNTQELANGTSPVLADTDGDGLSDSAEVNVHGTRPTVADHDRDTINDAEEIVAGADGFITNPALADTDGDEIDDDVEIAGGSDPTNAASIPAATLVLYYPFDAQNGNAVANGAGGPAGNIVGGGSYTAGPSPAFGTAFLGNRTGASDGRVETSLTASQFGLLSSYTAMAWVRWDGVAGPEDHMVFGQTGGTPQLHHGIRANNGGNNDVHFGHWGNDVDNSGTVTPGQWHHLAWTWDGSQGRIYVNGVETTSSFDNDVEGPIENSAVNRQVAIAYTELGNGGSFNGAVDEVKIFDRNLSAAEIAAASLPPAGSGPQISGISYDAATSRLLISVQGIPAGPTFHLKSSTTLQGWSALSPAVNFTSATPQPLAVPVNVGTVPKRFFRVEDGASP